MARLCWLVLRPQRHYHNLGVHRNPSENCEGAIYQQVTGLVNCHGEAKPAGCWTVKRGSLGIHQASGTVVASGRDKFTTGRKCDRPNTRAVPPHEAVGVLDSTLAVTETAFKKVVSAKSLCPRGALNTCGG